MDKEYDTSAWFSSRAMLNLIFVMLLMFSFQECQSGLRKYVIAVSDCDAAHVGDQRVGFDGELWECRSIDRRDTPRTFANVRR